MVLVSCIQCTLPAAIYLTPTLPLLLRLLCLLQVPEDEVLEGPEPTDPARALRRHSMLEAVGRSVLVGGQTGVPAAHCLSGAWESFERVRNKEHFLQWDPVA